MKKKYPDVINYFEDIIYFIYKDRILILIIISVCFLLSIFLYNPEKTYTSYIKIKKPPKDYYIQYAFDHNKIFTQYKENLLSIDSLENFTNSTEKYDNFKKYLKSKNINSRQYFSSNFFNNHSSKFSSVKTNGKIIDDLYSLDFPIESEINDFLNNYVEYVKRVTISEFKKNQFEIYKNTLKNLENNLKIAKKISYENPILKINEKFEIIVKDENQFYLGEEILKLKIQDLNELMQSLINEEFNFSIIRDSSFTVKSVSAKNQRFYILSLIYSFFLSLIIIYIKNTIKK
jgi:hypothetical protein